MSAALALVPADPRRIAEIDYPESDGAPVAETPVHFLAIVYLFLMLRERYKRLGPAYIGANMFLYFVQGDPRGVVSPDVYVVLGRPGIVGSNRAAYLDKRQLRVLLRADDRGRAVVPFEQTLVVGGAGEAVAWVDVASVAHLGPLLAGEQQDGQ